eukprot:Hpha_TRINITY_DN28241_c0_g1::TRINITY_DN28241_c0_g1_i1::g.116739::m.116739
MAVLLAGCFVAVRSCTVAEVQAGGKHTCVKMVDRTVRCWGDNTNGVLGYDDKSPRGSTAGTMGLSLPPLSLSFHAISTGGKHNCGRDGETIKCWGNNAQGQLGAGDTLDRGGQAGDMASLFTLTGPTVLSPCILIDFQVYLRHACLLCSRGDVYCWGDNAEGYLGVGDTAARGDAGGWAWAKVPITGYVKALSGDRLHCTPALREVLVQVCNV